MESVTVRGRVRVRLRDGTEHICPYFDFEGQAWIAPEWTIGRPARIISLNDLPTKNPDPPMPEVDREMIDPLDNEVFEGRRSSQKLCVIPMPEILLDWGE
jgi:hypothetical protein